MTKLSNMHLLKYTVNKNNKDTLLEILNRVVSRLEDRNLKVNHICFEMKHGIDYNNGELTVGIDRLLELTNKISSNRVIVSIVSNRIIILDSIRKLNKITV